MMKQKLFAAVCAFALCAALGTAIHAGQEAETAAPVAENLELTTFRNTSVGGTLSASAPDGSPLTFRITTEPIKGTVTLTDDGTFVYTPADGKRGRDYFGFRAADSSGRESQEATVIIAIKKQKPDVTYSDMAGRAEEYAAVMLAEQGVCVGRQVGGQYLFDPDSNVPRGEFLAMCMHLTGTETLQGVLSTGFGDDAQIPAWSKAYVATALMNGDVCGCRRHGDRLRRAARHHGGRSGRDAQQLPRALPRRRARERLYPRVGVRRRVEPDIVRRVSGRRGHRRTHHTRRGGTDAAGRV